VDEETKQEGDLPATAPVAESAEPGPDASPADAAQTEAAPAAGESAAAAEGAESNTVESAEADQDVPAADATPPAEAEAATAQPAPATGQGGEDEAPAAEGDSAAQEEEDLDEEEEEQDDEEEEYEGDVEPLELNLDEEPQEEDIEKDWYILKVQSNREASIRDGLARRVQVAGLDRFFGEIIVPTEDVADFKGGKKKIVKRKMYPGYIVVHMAINDDTWFLVRETPGIGDFTGAAGKPTPMLTHEVDRILKAMKPEKEGGEVVKTAIPFKPGDRVRIKDGTFENFEGEVEGIDEANGRVTVMINIFGRSTPAELEHWQIESL
jgi:transcriptional antiterminator NusG